MKQVFILLLVVLLVGCGKIDNHAAGGYDDAAEADQSAYGDEYRSPWDLAMPAGSHAVVAAANWTDPMGSLASVDLDGAAADTALVTTDGSDVVLQSFGGRVYIINRYGTDTIQVVDPDDFSVIANYSVGAGSNPQDIFVRSDEKAYISRLDAHNDPENSDDVIVVDPLTGEVAGGFNLKPYTQDDGDRFARAAQMVGVDDKLYVILQDLPSNLLESADAPAKIVVIDMETDEVAGSIELEGRNSAEIAYSPATGKLYVSNSGVYTSLGVVNVSDPHGGIEVIDPLTMQTEGIVVDDAEFGDYVMQVRIGRDLGFVIVGGMTIASFDIDTYELVSASLYASPGMFVPDIAVDEEGRVLIAERDAAAPGIVFLDGADGTVLAGPVDVGALPAAITFVDIVQ
jgi:hypothetical protein